MAGDDQPSEVAPSYEPTLPYNNGKALESSLPQARIPVPKLEHRREGPLAILRLENADSPQYRDDKAGNAAFIQQLQATRPVEVESLASVWDYNKRRTAQAILPYLFLGPAIMMKDAPFLDEEGITFMLAVRSAPVARTLPRYLNAARYLTANNRQTATFDLDGPFDLITRIKPAIKLIVDHLEANTTTPIASMNDIRARVLICCETGNDRSAAFMVAFLMLVYGFDNNTAMQLVYSQRCCVSLDDGMRRMLADFNDLLVAERQVAQAHSVIKQDSTPHPQPALPAKSNKRGFSSYDEGEDEDEDEDMGGVDQSFNADGSRLGIAPFR